MLLTEGIARIRAGNPHATIVLNCCTWSNPSPRGEKTRVSFRVHVMNDDKDAHPNFAGEFDTLEEAVARANGLVGPMPCAADEATKDLTEVTDDDVIDLAPSDPAIQ